jgi:AraC-like DNA-binding protein
MRYLEFPPTAALSRYIKCFWFLESEGSTGQPTERILPDGCTEIVFNLADPFAQHNADGSIRKQPLALLVGQMRRHLLIQPTGRVEILGIRFWPAGAYPFLAFPQDQIAERVLDFGDVSRGIVRDIHSRLSDSSAASERVRLVQELLLGQLKKSAPVDGLVDRAVELITRTAGSVPVLDLADKLGISLRGLDRQFNTRVGFPPKSLCRIVRFQRALQMFSRKSSTPDWARVALECGYYDQPHFIREFKSFAGKEPSSYFRETNVMSDYFTQTA